MLIIPEGYAQSVVTISDPNITDGFALVTLGLKVDPSLTLSDAAVAILTALGDAGMDDPLASAATITQALVYTDTETGLATANLTGNNGNAMPPPNVTTLVEKRTAARGRRGQGRNFWPSIVQETAIDASGHLDSTVYDNLQNIFDDYRDNLVASLLGPVILQGDGGQSAPLDPPPAITRFVVDPVVSTQRRRLRR